MHRLCMVWGSAPYEGAAFAPPCGRWRRARPYMGGDVRSRDAPPYTGSVSCCGWWCQLCHLMPYFEWWRYIVHATYIYWLLCEIMTANARSATVGGLWSAPWRRGITWKATLSHSRPSGARQRSPTASCESYLLLLFGLSFIFSRLRGKAPVWRLIHLFIFLLMNNWCLGNTAQIVRLQISQKQVNYKINS